MQFDFYQEAGWYKNSITERIKTFLNHIMWFLLYLLRDNYMTMMLNTGKE